MKSAAILFAAALFALLPTRALSATEFHVAVTGDDAHDGSAARPFKTISAAAQAAMPGDVVTVHEGLYRERVDPPRGGESSVRRIVYRAAPGEHAEIRGSELVKGWENVQDCVWKVTVPDTLFGEFNPYCDPIHGDWFNPKNRAHHTGAVYLNGDWLIEAAELDEVLNTSGTRPDWLTRAGDEYLLNVAWLQPEGGERIPATAFVEKNGTQNAACEEGGDCIGFIAHGHWVRYDGLTFGDSPVLALRVASATRGGVVEVRRDGPNGELLGSCKVPNTGGWQSWKTLNCELDRVSGESALCLLFKGMAPETDALRAPLWFAQVDADATTIWAQFPGVDPNAETVEINVRRAVFYPSKPGMNYITVRGFTMRHAATNWAPPTAEQVGLIGTHWSKGWIIEDNVVSQSVCSGIALGKHGDEFDNTSADTAEGYVKTIERAIEHGWSKENIGHHIVDNNTISHCEQTGIVGSLGAVFSTVTNNTIHDIHVRQLFSGAEMAGIKLHAAIDVVIERNHIYRTCRGLWLDWMNQGSRVTRNLFHENSGEDIFVEVDHGPFAIDNNLLLSPTSILSLSRGGAFAHNLFAGAVRVHKYDARLTPYHEAHSTVIAGMHDNPHGDDRYYNNVFVGNADLTVYDDASMPVFMSGNVFLNGAKPSKYESGPVVKPQLDPGIMLVEKEGNYTLTLDFDTLADDRARALVTTDLLGRAAVPDLPYENRDGTPLRIDKDYFGNARNAENPAPGPFATPEARRMKVR